MENEVKLNIQQLLVLYTGGRPVGVKDFGEQYDEFYDNYSVLIKENPTKECGFQMRSAKYMGYKNFIKLINAQYPKLRASKEFMEIYKEYIRKVPTIYNDRTDDAIVDDPEYQQLGKRLIEAAKKVYGEEKYFFLKSISKIRR